MFLFLSEICSSKNAHRTNFYVSNIYANTLQCYVIRTFPVLSHSGDVFVDELKHTSYHCNITICKIFVGMKLFFQNMNLEVFEELDVEHIGQ